MDHRRSRKGLEKYSALDPDRLSIQKLNDRLLEVFVVHLIQDQKIKEKTARAHAGRIGHFGEAYLLDLEEIPLSEADAPDIEDYLGNWFPKIEPDLSPKESKKILDSLGMFYRHMYEIQEIDREVLRGIVETCRDRHRLLS
ncbi:MAG: hypothetical protein O7H41_20595 [Planctomycetota bacterium]|nr:hypothetical protein [Planctomycetota bacterium]